MPRMTTTTSPAAAKSAGLGTRAAALSPPSEAPHARQTVSPGLPGAPQVGQTTGCGSSFTTSYSSEGGAGSSLDSPTGTTGTLRTTLQVLQRSFLPESSTPTV